MFKVNRNNTQLKYLLIGAVIVAAVLLHLAVTRYSPVETVLSDLIFAGVLIAPVAVVATMMAEAMRHMKED
jgi:hypothetical protein